MTTLTEYDTSERYQEIQAPPMGNGNETSYAISEEALIDQEMKAADSVLERVPGVNERFARYIGYVPLHEVTFGEPVARPLHLLPGILDAEVTTRHFN